MATCYRNEGADESGLSDETLDEYGVSYWWIMDLAGNVWERVITFGSPDGRGFSGSHGDGALGGYYGADAAWHEFNPFSPVAYRRFGGWSGYAPHLAYGYRAARSANR